MQLRLLDIENSTGSCRAWFCVRTHPKHERIAAARLRNLISVEVFNPRLRLRRPTRRGPVWMIEPVFPCYVFARFDLARQLDSVRFAFGVRTVVAFGAKVPAVPDEVVESLRTEMGGELYERSLVDLVPGEEIRVAAGPFCGLVGTVRQVLTPKERVQVLLRVQHEAVRVHLAVLLAPVIGRQSGFAGRPGDSRGARAASRRPLR